MEGGRPPVRQSIEFTRIVAFTDGVFAIAITLLVLTLEVPSDLPGSELHDYLLDSWRQLFTYFLSFAVIGRYWIGHHSMFSMLDHFDRRLMMLNLAYLSLIVLIPFPTELLGDYSSRPAAAVFYAVVVGSASLLSWMMFRYALSRGQIESTAREAAAKAPSRMLQPVIVFYASIPVALVSPQIAQIAWLGLLLGVLRR